MRYRITGERGWKLIFGFIVVHELVCERDQLLSQAVDRWLDRRPWTTRIFFGVTTLHLLNHLPAVVDPYHWIAVAGDKLKQALEKEN